MARAARRAVAASDPAGGITRSRRRAVKPGGRIAYVTCSVLVEENDDQVLAFIERNADFSVEKPADMAQGLGERAYLFTHAALISDAGLLMTPRRTDTDGFFVSLMRRNS